MTIRVVVALLLAGCARPAVSPPAPVEPSPDGSQAAPRCNRAKWSKRVARAIETSARDRTACPVGCYGAPITDKQAAGIVDWYCARATAEPRADLLWTAIDEGPVDRAAFWNDAKSSFYDLRLESGVGAWRDRERFAYDLVDREAFARRVTLDVHGEGDQLAGWIDFYFTAGDELVGVNLGSGSACPFIATAFDGGAFVEHGEILTDLRHPSLEATQSLATAGPAPCARVVVRVLERKPETTYLDSLELDLAGARFAPTTCPGATYCVDDGVYHRLERDESLDLAFDLPPGSDCTSARVIANGHYIPY